MTTTINASTTAGLVQTADTSGVLALQTAGTTAVTVDASQNVGIGTASPTAYGAGFVTMCVNGSTQGTIQCMSAGTIQLSAYGNSTDSGIGTLTATPFRFLTNATERMRIDSSGRVGINATPSTSTTAQLQVTGGNTNATTLATAYSTATAVIVPKSSSGYSLQFGSGPSDVPYIQMSAGGSAAGDLTIQPYGGIVLIGGTTARTTQAKLELTSATNTALSFYMYKTSQVEMAMGFKSSTDTNFYIGTGSASVGTNGVYLQNTGSSWIAVSDERFKTELQPIENALSKISNIRAVTGRYIYDEENGKSSRRSFLIAQDFVEALPEAVDQQNPDKLGLSYSDTIPLLYAAIQEQQALITQLQADVAALKGATP